MRRSAILVILVCVAISGTVVAQEKAMAKGSAEIPQAGAPAPQTQGPLTRPARAAGLARDESKQGSAWMPAAQSKLESELVAKYGEGQRERARRGLKQVGEFWRAEDGDQPAFEAFVRANFAGDQATLDTTFARFEKLMEQLEGHMQEIGRELRTQADLDLGPMLPLDETFAGFDAGAHVIDDMFRNKLAFVVLLNFPLTTLDQRLNEGQHWTRRQWAEARLAQRFSKRVPAEVNQAIAQAQAEADHYISEYNIWMYHVVREQESGVRSRESAKADSSPASRDEGAVIRRNGETQPPGAKKQPGMEYALETTKPPSQNATAQRLFPKGMRLLSHWNLRDEIKADYDLYPTAPKAGAAGAPVVAQNGLVRQRTVQQVLERIVTQTIPEAVVNNPQVDWNPWTNQVKPAEEKDSDFVPSRDRRRSGSSNEREPDTRYATLQKTYFAARKMDPYSPTAPTLIARRFDENREIPEARVRKMLVDIVSSALVPKVVALIEKRLGRPLAPFDVWYSGFRPKSEYTEAQLDEIVRQRYPTAEAYRKDIPNLLVKLGFSPERAQYVAQNIVVDPARGSGHAMGAAMRDAKVHLRTRVEKTGMNYKGFNIAVHEMGHNVEQTFSMKDVDQWLLAGVPNTAFTEALAFVFQARDLELLGLHAPSAQDEAMRTLNDFWGTYEIAGVALVDMAVWHWMYDHPNATPAELREATVQIAKDTWNQYYAPVFKQRDVVLLGVYSHMIDYFLYLPDYPIGHMIAFQIEEQIKKAGKIGPEFERMASFGSVAPDLWMVHATGKPVGPEALLQATERALGEIRE
ncbi:MAG TPA: hypothetical protein VF840_02050 [Terriglobales bacterium]